MLGAGSNMAAQTVVGVDRASYLLPTFSVVKLRVFSLALHIKMYLYICIYFKKPVHTAGWSPLSNKGKIKKYSVFIYLTVERMAESHSTTEPCSNFFSLFSFIFTNKTKSIKTLIHPSTHT